ncbi:MAG: MBL fold metallo-hydrolase [Sediminibacterium sp.]|jgi:7,8-dihydropterin-6-yl-methyl-4-(beta-D-ribofuranosyl)aminobenzene 5'-phosphate synthase
MKKLVIFICVKLLLLQGLSAQPHHASNVKVTILSTMLAQKGIGEWGFSALIEVDSNKILFDAGGRPNTVLENAKELKINLSKVPTMVLSHWHDDHTAGWLPLRHAVKSVQTNALAKTHVANGFFNARYAIQSKEVKSRINDSIDYVSNGGLLVQHSQFEEILPGVFLTGNVPRIHNEKNYYNSFRLLNQNNQLVDDNIPDDMSLVISTKEGLILISGCGHSGIVNTIEHVSKNLPGQKIVAAIGGFHLLNSSNEQLKWTAEQLKKVGIKYFMGAHCTGIESVFQIRNFISLERGDCVVGSVGDSFQLNKGFITGDLNK